MGKTRAKPKTKDTTGRLTLITGIGERKYLTAAERARFLDALSVLDNARERSFCAMLFWTGCRPSEALALRALHIDLDENTVIIRSLKKRGAEKGRSFRVVPIPSDFTADLEATHGIRTAQAQLDGGTSARLWTFSRTTAWKRVRKVMNEAGLSGVRASGRGLRHGYGVHAAMSRVPETRIKKWLGHVDLSTTEIYLDIAGDEDRAIAARMWRDGATETTLNEKETV